MKFPRFIWSTAEHILDAVLPPRARSARTRARRADEIPLEVMTHDLLGVRITTLMDYRKGAVQDLVRSLKYDASGHAAKLAAELLADYLREELSSIRLFSQCPVLLMPVPLHKTRLRERGYNQIEIVLDALPKEFKDGTLSKLAARSLARIRATPHQTKLQRAERITNIAGAFTLSDVEGFAAPALANTHIFLIDDVTTTGATLLHAGKPLRAAVAEVTLLALARA